MAHQKNILAIFIATLALINLITAMEPDQHGPFGTRPVLRSNGVGLTNGTVFDDLRKLKNSILAVRSITYAAFYQVESIQFSYTLKDGSIYRPPKRGEGFTVPQTIKLAEDEYVSKIEGTTVYNTSVSHVYITIKSTKTPKSRVYGPLGATVGERTFTFEGYILGIHGKTGPSFTRQVLGNLGVYYLAPVYQSEYFGIPYRTFYENPDESFPPVVKISKIFVYHGDRVDSLQVEYLLLNGKTRLGNRHGGNSSALTTINFDHGEELIQMKGKMTEYALVDVFNQLTFVSKKKDGSTAIYGPFGKGGEKLISINGRILGFVGSANENFNLVGLGVFYY